MQILGKSCEYSNVMSSHLNVSTPVEANSKLKQLTLEELFGNTPLSNISNSPKSPSSSQRRKCVQSSNNRSAVSSPSNTPLCGGISLTTGLPCRRLVTSDNFCFHHRSQRLGLNGNLFGMPTTPRNGILDLSETVQLTEARDLVDIDDEASVKSVTREQNSPIPSLLLDESDNEFKEVETLVNQLNEISIAKVETLYDDKSQRRDRVHDRDIKATSSSTSKTEMQSTDSLIVPTLPTKIEHKPLKINMTQSSKRGSSLVPSKENSNTPSVSSPIFSKTFPSTPSETTHQKAKTPTPFKTNFTDNMFRTPPTPTTNVMNQEVSPHSPRLLPEIYDNKQQEIGCSDPSGQSFKSDSQKENVLLSPKIGNEHLKSRETSRQLLQSENSELPDGEYKRESNSVQRSSEHPEEDKYFEIWHDFSAPSNTSESSLPSESELEESWVTQSKKTEIESTSLSKSFTNKKSIGVEESLSNPNESSLLTTTCARVQIDFENQKIFTAPSDSSSFKKSPGSIRCQGCNSKTGNQCARSIKITNETANLVEWHCFQHRVENANLESSLIMESLAFVPGQSKIVWLRFEDWVKKNLKPETKKMLVEEMKKPISDGDEPGFIYAYQLVDGPSGHHDPNYNLYKVGRATNVQRRLYQWLRQCGYEPTVIEYFPNVTLPSSCSHHGSFTLNVEDDQDDNGLQPELINAFINGPKCKYTHRAERLIHIELGDKYHANMPKCEGCGNYHREWFKLPASDLDDWDELRRVIVHWLTYIEKTYGVG
ncbi:hypothetical protein G9A89_014485 [Geosiphon pyriformis]|nr:hypothetical protein G9A89_014485 [Geosiphon pyriformis]